MRSLEQLSSPVSAEMLLKLIIGNGDSTTNGTGSNNGEDTIRAAIAQHLGGVAIVTNNGIGGAPPGEVADRYIRHRELYRDCIVYFDFGRCDYGEPATHFADQAKRCWDMRTTDRMLFCVPGPGASDAEKVQGSAQITISNDARYDLMTRFPNHYIDQMAPLWDAVEPGDAQVDLDAVPTFADAEKTTITNGRGYCPPKGLLDGIHRLGTFQRLSGYAIGDAILAKGYV